MNTSTKILTDEQRHESRALALAASLTRVGRALTGDYHLQVQCVAGADVLAYTEWKARGIVITIGRKAIEFKGAADYVRNVGLFYHELGHALFTPSSRVMSVPDQAAYNALEDSRVERLLIAEYPSTLPYLSAIIARFIIDADDNSRTQPRDKAAQVFPLIAGRRYLPAKLRSEALRQMLSYVNGVMGWSVFRDGVVERNVKGDAMQLTTDMQALVDEYVQLVLPRDRVQATDLIRTFASMLAALRSRPDMIHSNATGKAASIGDGKSASEQTQEEAQAVASEAEGAGSAQGDPQNGKGGQGEAEGDGEGADGDSDSDDETPGTGGTSAGTGAAEFDSDSAVGDMRTIREMAEALAEGAVDHSGKEATSMGEPEAIGHVNTTSAETFTPRPEDVMASLSFEQAMRKLVADVDPGWERRRPSGKLNVQRAMTGETDLDELFDEWHPGRTEDTKVEIVMLIDCSGSMANSIGKVLSSAWAVKRACDKLRNPVSAVVYNSQASLLWSSADRVPGDAVPGILARGGTSGTGACTYAARAFDASREKNRVLLAFTDGSWDDMQQAGRMVARMNEVGVHTFLVGYGTDQSTERIAREHGHFQRVVHANNADAMLTVAREIVTAVGQAAARQR